MLSVIGARLSLTLTVKFLERMENRGTLVHDNQMVYKVEYTNFVRAATLL